MTRRFDHGADTLLPVVSCVDPFERHYTPKELAELWHVDPKIIRRLFDGKPGVLKIEFGGRNKRKYTTLRIPASAAARIYRERVG